MAAWTAAPGIHKLDLGGPSDRQDAGLDGQCSGPHRLMCLDACLIERGTIRRRGLVGIGVVLL